MKQRGRSEEHFFSTDQMYEYILRNILAYVIKNSSQELVLFLKRKTLQTNNKYFTKLSKLALKH